MQLIRKVVIAFLVITVFASSNYIFNDNADYQKASAASGIEELLGTSLSETQLLDSRYTYYVRSINTNSDNRFEQFRGFDKSGNIVWDFRGPYAQVPNDKGIVNLQVNGVSGAGIAIITRKINDNRDPSYNPTNILEFVNFMSHTGLDFSKYSYHIQSLNPETTFTFTGWDLYNNVVWRSEPINYSLQVPENQNIYSISVGLFGGNSQFAIFRKLKNASPSLNILTANNQVLS